MMHVEFTNEIEETWQGDIYEFFARHKFNYPEQQDILAALKRRGAYRGHGLVGSRWTLRRLSARSTPGSKK